MRQPKPKRERRPPARPTEALLHEAALNHLARFAATEAGLKRVLGNRVRRWAQAALRSGAEAEEDVAAHEAAARGWAAAIAARLVQAGAVNDAAFAEARARRLLRGGRSARGALAHLAQKGVDAETARDALAADDVPDEGLAALMFCRRRRIGPFAPEGAAADADRDTRLKWLAALARAGFPREVADAALRTPRDAAEERVRRA
ncbi:MAG: RecX family transcriptional regulator [Acetobacteraceae bacterium]|nr:RecX family transcriptional regulator [Acetobacteraceae bacterium]